MHCCLHFRLAVFAGILFIVGDVFAQGRPLGASSSSRASGASPADKTIVEVELLADGPLGGGLRAQQWSETLQNLGVAVRVRQPIATDKPGVTERTRGTLRWVKVVGALGADGKIVLPEREFAPGDAAGLRQWIEELKVYGAQGAPEGKPLWGLDEPQFKALFAALGAAIPEDEHGETLDRALKSMNLPEAYPLRFHSSAAQHMSKTASVPPVRQRLGGVSVGTGLAAALADYGLGFRPLRIPAGEIELVVQPLADIADPWPVGWELPKDASRMQLAPALFKMVPVKFDDVPLQDVIDAIARAAGTPVIVDYRGLEVKGVDLARTTLSYPAKRIAWIQILHSLAARNGLTEELRVDEQGKAFVYIAPFTPRRVGDAE